MNLNKHGATVNTDNAWAQVRNTKLSTSLDELGVYRRESWDRNKGTVQGQTAKLEGNTVTGKDFTLGVHQISGPGDPVDAWHGSFGEHPIRGLDHKGVLMTFDNDRAASISYDGVRIGPKERFTKPTFTSFDDIAKSFVRKIKA